MPEVPQSINEQQGQSGMSPSAPVPSLMPQMGVTDAMSRPQIINSICLSLVSPHAPCRKISAELLIFFCLWDETEGQGEGKCLSMVLASFDYVEQILNAAIVDVANKVGKFDMWLKQLDGTIEGRGRMGSMVGMSKEFGEAVHVHEYCVSGM